MDIFFSIIYNSIIPIFILITLGYLVDKRLNLDSNTLTKVNFYLFVPAFSFVLIYTTDISADLARVIALHASLLFVNFLIGAGLGRLFKMPLKTKKAFENALMFYNSGNIGVSLITLVFSNPPFAAAGSAPFLKAALSVQIMTLLVQNLSVNTIGFINSGGEGITLKTGTLRVLKMPALYTISCAVLFKFIPVDFTATPVWPALDNLRAGLISIALVNLGVQLSKTNINFKRKLPYLAAFCRLLLGPAAAFIMVKLFGFTGVLAQAAFISSATRTAVNTALLSADCKGDAEFAVQAVTTSTLLSAVTMTTVVYLAYIIF